MNILRTTLLDVNELVKKTSLPLVNFPGKSLQVNSYSKLFFKYQAELRYTVLSHDKQMQSKSNVMVENIWEEKRVIGTFFIRCYAVNECLEIVSRGKYQHKQIFSIAKKD